MYDATTKIESIKIPNLIPTRSIEVPAAANAAAAANATQHVDGEYQLFVNRREEICVMQSSADVDCGRYIKVSSLCYWIKQFSNLCNGTDGVNETTS